MPSNGLIRFRFARTVCVAAAVLGLVAMSGCAKSKSTVKGKVRFEGKDLTFGNVQFEVAGAGAFVAPIQSDGTYKVDNVPVGSARVMVSAMDPSFGEKLSELAGRNKGGASDPSKAGARAAPAPGGGAQ